MRTAPRFVAVLLTLSMLLVQDTCEAQQPDNPGQGGGPGKASAEYQVIDLGGFAVPSGNGSFIQSYAYSLNEPDEFGDVQIVGESYVAPLAAGESPPITPTLWTLQPDGSVLLTDLGLLPGERHARATDVSELGEITISTYQSLNLEDGHPVLPAWYLPAAGSPRQELARNALQAEALALNNLGMIVGFDHSPFPLGVAWNAAVPEEQDSTGMFNPTSIDESGVMAGYESFSPGADSGIPSIAWFEGGTLQIEYLDFFANGTATSISPNGDYVAGWLETGTVKQAFLWTQGTGIVPLGTLGGESSVAMSVNDLGQVVGWSDTEDRKHPKSAFLWDAGMMKDLNSISDGPRRSHLLEANKINNAGNVCGYLEVTAQGSRSEHAFGLLPLTTE